jgi:hypothetical protein
MNQDQPLNVGEAYLTIPVVAFVSEDTGKPDAVPCSGPSDADAEAYHRKYVKNQPAEAVDLDFLLSDVFPKGELYTLFDGETKECVGLFRTQADATAGNKEWHGADFRKFAVLRIDFNQ